MTIDDGEGEEATTRRPRSSRPGQAARLVAVVVVALVYGALVIVSNILPNIGGDRLLYPAPGVGPPFGIWFGFWGGLGAVLGNLLTAFPLGLNPLPLLPAYLIQGVYMWIPSLYGKGSVRGGRDWARFALICALASAVVSLTLTANLVLIGTVPFGLAVTTLLPVNFVTDWLWMVVLGSVVLNVVSPYVEKAGLQFRTFF